MSLENGKLLAVEKKHLLTAESTRPVAKGGIRIDTSLYTFSEPQSDKKDTSLTVPYVNNPNRELVQVYNTAVYNYRIYNSFHLPEPVEQTMNVLRPHLLGAIEASRSSEKKNPIRVGGMIVTYKTAVEAASTTSKDTDQVLPVGRTNEGFWEQMTILKNALGPELAFVIILAGADGLTNFSNGLLFKNNDKSPFSSINSPSEQAALNMLAGFYRFR